MANDLTIEQTLALEISERKMYETLHFEELQREAKLREALQVIGNGATKEGRPIYELGTAMAIARQALKDCASEYRDNDK